MESTKELMGLYHAYRHTADIDAKGQFFSLVCSQICRPMPSYAATNRETIVRYLHEAQSAGKGLATATEAGGDTSAPAKKGYYTIRPLAPAEFEFGTEEHVQPAGFATVSDVERKARDEGWVGMRVDLWEDEGEDDKGVKQGLLVKVQYWWRKEEGGWMQILHDILYLGPRDGTEGDGLEVLE